MHPRRAWSYLSLCALFGLAHAQTAAAQPSSLAEPLWPHSASDIAPDPAVLYGVLDNGMRYALVRNQLPPGTVAIQMVFGVGSIHEAENERGLAHFIEHMAFNGTTHVPEGEMVKTLERLGLAIGADANANTGYRSTAYMLNLNHATEAALDESLFLMREVASEVTFAPDAIERERGVVLSEWRQVQGPLAGWFQATYDAIAPGSLLARRDPAGERAIIETAPRERMVSMYERYYRPERATLVVTGDIDVEAIRVKIEALFADWKGKGTPGTDPEPYQPPTRPTTAYVYSHPKGPDVVRSVAVTPIGQRHDSAAVRRENDLMRLAVRVLLQRLTSMVHQENPPFRQLQLTDDDLYGTVHEFSLGATTRPGGMKAAIRAFENEWRRAVLFGFTKQELSEAIEDELSGLRWNANQASNRGAWELNGRIVNALVDQTVFSSPAAELARFEGVAAEATPEVVHAEVKRRLGAVSPIILVSTSVAPPSGIESELVQTWHESAKVELQPLAPAAPSVFAYTSFGLPGKVVSDTRMADVDARLIAFANNVRLTIKKTALERDVVYASVRVGHGALDLPPKPLGFGSLIGQIGAGGLEKHSADELERMFRGRAVYPSFKGFTTFYGGGYLTTPADLLTQLQVAAAFTTAPGFRPAAERTWREEIEESYPSYDASSTMVWYTKAQRLLASGDERWGGEVSERVHERTFAELKPLVMPSLTKGPVEITIVGDIDEQHAIDSVAQTFGALPERAPPDGKVRDDVPVVFRKDKSPIVLSHTGEPVDAQASLLWPVTVDSDLDPRAARVLRLMCTVMGRKVIDEVREALGVAYSPSVEAALLETDPGFNHVAATANVEPEDVDVTLDVFREIAARMRAGEISEDELARAMTPLLDALPGETSDNIYWLALLDQAQSRPARTKRMTVAAREAELRSITKADIVAAANAWLTEASAQEVRILPKLESGVPRAVYAPPPASVHRGGAQRSEPFDGYRQLTTRRTRGALCAPEACAVTPTDSADKSLLPM